MASSTSSNALMSLSAEMKKRSRSIHSISDSLVNAKLVMLFTDRKLFGRGLGMFYYVFKTIEELLTQHMIDPDISPFAETLVKLFRAPRFEQDLQFYLGPNWRSEISPSPPLARYMQYLHDLAARKPMLLLAHAYTQHLAVAAGGQIIRRMAERAMGLEEDKGVATFMYEASPSLLKHEMRQEMDKLGQRLGHDDYKEVIHEHLQAFRFNNSMIRDFEVGFIATCLAVVRVAIMVVLILLAILMVACLVLKFTS